MRYITDKITWTKSMKDFAELTISQKLDRLVDNYNDMTITLSKLNKNKVKVTIAIDSFRTQATEEDFYIALVDAAVRLKNIITKYRKKYIQIAQQKEPVVEEEIVDPIIDLVSKEKVFELKPTTLDEAIRAFEQTDYAFYVYRDIDDKNQVTVIYHRNEDTYGIIRCH